MFQIDMSIALKNIAASYIVGLLIVLFIILRYKNRSASIYNIAIYFLLSLVGALLLFFSDKFPIFIGSIIARLSSLAALLFFLRGILSYLNKELEKRYYIVSFVVLVSLLLFFTYVYPSVSSRLFSYFITGAIVHVILAYNLSKAQDKKYMKTNLAIWASRLYVVYYVARALSLLITKESYTAYMDYSYDALFVFAEGAFSLILFIGFQSLINNRNYNVLMQTNKDLDFFADVYRNSPIPIAMFDKDQIVMHVNQSMCDLLLVKEGDIIGKKTSEAGLASEYAQEEFDLMEQLRNKRGNTTFRAEVIRSNGTRVPIEAMIHLNHDEYAEEYFTVFLYDMTIINIAQDELIEAERAKNSILSNIPGFVYKCNYDKDWTMQELSDGFESVTSYKPEEVLRNHTISYSDMIVEEYKIPLQEAWNVCTKEKTRFVGEYEIIQKNGKHIWVWEQGDAVYDYDGYVIALEGFITNINDLKSTEGELRKFKTISENSAHGNAITDTRGKIIYVNDYFARIHGYKSKELIGKNLSSLFSKKREGNISITSKNFLDVGYLEAVETWHVKKDGEELPMLISGIVIEDNSHLPEYVALTAIDITKLKELEVKNQDIQAYLRNQQKLESVGTLAGGIAHEINNPINGIMNYSQLILDTTEKNNDTYEYAKEIIHETRRVATIVRNLLHFSRHETSHRSKARIHDIIEATLSLIRTIIKRDQIDLSIELPKELPRIQCSSQQIQQVLMNLMTNARDALNQKYEGYDENKKIIVTGKVIKKNKQKWLRITIEDHGGGIPQEVQDKIFDPFFTTKGRTEGTGLGLSISYGIVKEHKGTLSFETKKGEYTKFHMDLMAIEGDE